MARKPRVHFPGALYHTISRGNQGRSIFRDDDDRKRYLAILQGLPTRFGCKLYAYVLMGNHVHLLIQVAKIPLSKIMQNLQFRYTRQYNRRYRKVGHLFQGRYKAIVCDRDSYLLELVRYIHLNPIRSGIVRRPDRYRWSSHREYLQGNEAQGVSVNLVLEQFGKRQKEAIRRYREFTRDGLGEGHRKDLYDVIDKRFLGDEEFVEDTRERVEKPDTKPPVDIALKDIVGVVCSRFNVLPRRVRQRDKSREISRVRWIIGKIAVEEAGYRLTEVARYLSRDAGVVSRGLRQLEDRIQMDGTLRRRIGTIRAGIRKGRKPRTARRHA